MELLHPAPRLLTEAVRAVPAVGKSQALPEGQSGLLIRALAGGSLAEALPLGFPREWSTAGGRARGRRAIATAGSRRGVRRRPRPLGSRRSRASGRTGESHG